MAASLATEPVSKLIADKKWLISVSKEDSIATVLDVLNKYNITSVPVYDPKAKHFVALASSMMIMSFVAFDTYFKRHKKEQITFQVNLPDLSRPIIDLLYSPHGRSEFHGPAMSITIDDRATLRQVLETFSQGIHRVMVGDGTPEKTKMLSQVDVILFLLDKYGQLPAASRKSLDELGLVLQHRLLNKIVAMSVKNSAVEGFRKIYRQGVSAIAILSDDDKLVGTLSASDVRGLTPDNVNLVLQPVLEFLSKKYPNPRPPVTLSRNDTLKEVMEKIIMGKVHRVWIVDANNRPIGVVTLSDVIRIVFEALKKELVN